MLYLSLENYQYNYGEIFMVYPIGVKVEGKLANSLQYWRAERPDEWTMDDFIRDAQKLHKKIVELEDELEMYKNQPTID